MPTDATTLDRVVKAYDVRGLVGVEIDAELARAVGAAVAQVLADGRSAIVVGHDARPASDELVAAFAEGVCGRGLDVISIGLCSTDQLYYASGVLDLPGAMFTASHNPAEYHGVKLCRAGAAPVGQDTGLAEIAALIRTGRASAAATSGPAGQVRTRDLLGEFAAHVRSFATFADATTLSVAVDAGNGMAGLVVPAVTAGLPIDVEPLYFELDGTFPNHPADPLDPANLLDLQDAVRAGGHALGLAFDGDADRVFAVDERGEAVSASAVGALVSARLLERHPGATILHNLICSRVVPETIRAHGGVAVRTRVGHSFVKQRMAETGAVFACEHSGHYYFRDHFRADSGLIAAVVLLEAVAEAGVPLSEVLAPYDRYAASGERNHRVDDVAGVLAAVEGAFAGRAVHRDHDDGLTVVLDDGWFNLRPSNTEPLLRLNVEADDAAALGELVAEVERLIPRG